MTIFTGVLGILFSFQAEASRFHLEETAKFYPPYKNWNFSRVDVSNDGEYFATWTSRTYGFLSIYPIGKKHPIFKKNFVIKFKFLDQSGLGILQLGTSGDDVCEIFDYNTEEEILHFEGCLDFYLNSKSRRLIIATNDAVKILDMDSLDVVHVEKFSNRLRFDDPLIQISGDGKYFAYHDEVDQVSTVTVRGLGGQHSWSFPVHRLKKEDFGSVYFQMLPENKILFAKDKSIPLYEVWNYQKNEKLFTPELEDLPQGLSTPYWFNWVKQVFSEAVGISGITVNLRNLENFSVEQTFEPKWSDRWAYFPTSTAHAISLNGEVMLYAVSDSLGTRLLVHRYNDQE